MKYFYEDLSPAQFESLVVCICQRLFGISVQGFTEGKDGGKDAKFMGTAELFPSESAPWQGTTIIQAKHTNGFNRHFSELDFYSKTSEKTVLGKEILRIRNLRQAKQLDHYMLFANRRLGGIAEGDIRKYIADACGLPEQSIYLCDVQQLDLWLKKFPEIAQIVDLDPVDSPLIVSPDDLSEVVQMLAKNKGAVSDVMDDPPTKRVSYAEKNVINNMTENYAVVLRRKYLKETAYVQQFLAAPENLELLKKYESVADEFQLKIIAKRKDFQSFDCVMEYLVDLLFDRDPILRQSPHKRLTRAVLFYMYWHCDIGLAEAVTDAKTN